MTLCCKSSFFRRSLRYSLGQAAIVYRLIDGALTRNFLLSLLILKSKFSAKCCS